MSKKGFMFVETIATMTVLMSLLIILYTIFINLLQKQKTNAEYESYGDKMYLFYIKEEMIKNGNYFNDSGEYLKNEAVLNISSEENSDLYHCYNEDDSRKRNYCLKSLVVGTCDGNLINYVYKNIEGVTVPIDAPSENNVEDSDFLKYINTIHTCDKESEKIILFGRFMYYDTSQKHYFYAHIGFPNYTD